MDKLELNSIIASIESVDVGAFIRDLVKWRQETDCVGIVYLLDEVFDTLMEHCEFVG